MKKIGRFFTNPTVISIIGLLFIAALIWFAGPYIKFGESNIAPLGSAVARLVAILVAVALWGLNNLRVQYKNSKYNNALTDDLRQNEQPDAEDLSSGQAAEEVHQINQRFADALSTLNKLRFGGKGKKRALYELPWYIIIGPPGSGKTTALVNSGLEFPLRDHFGKEALQGVGGTRNCDWWFTNDAVLIDTAGRYTTQDSHRVIDSSAWEGFLGLLKRHRRRRPINGAIVAISLHDLLMQTEDERALHARTIRARLDELMNKLEIRFPVYLMFTKADLVSGFNEFFEDLGKEERDQVWGVSLPNAHQASQAPDFDYLVQELRQLNDRLYSRVLWRMHQERDQRRCGAIQGFPQQMENLTAIIDSFVRQTFVQNRFEKQPYLRGVYLSSGTQDGTPIDRMMTSVAANFGFAADGAQMASRQGKSYFITRLLKEVVFPEAELVGSNARYEKFMRWSQRAAYGGLALVTAVILSVWTGSVLRHKGYMNEVVAQINTFESETAQLAPWSDLAATLPALDALAVASTVYDRQSAPWLSGIGMYDGRIDENAEHAYSAQLRALFQPRLLQTMELVLTEGDTQGDLYNTYRVYMMFNRTEHMDKRLVSEWFNTHWTANMHGEATSRNALDRHLQALLQLEPMPSELNDRIVQRTRDALLRLPVSQRVYSRLKNQPDNNTPVDMLGYFGEGVRSYYQVDERRRNALTVPAMFTAHGYRNIDLSADAPVVSDVLNERWMFADESGSRVTHENNDLTEISERVEAQYMADYVRSWNAVYAALEVAPFRGLQHASDVLTDFADPVYSPLRAVLEVGIDNTQLTPPVADTLAENAEGKAGRIGKLGAVAKYAAGRVDGTPVDKHFRDIHALKRASNRDEEPLDSITGHIKDLAVYMREISMAPDPAQKAFNIAKARYQTGEANPITALRSYATTVPEEPVGRWLRSLSDEAWRVVLREAHQHINREWHSQVYSVYGRALAGRYPLNPSASGEIAVYDFSAFFKPNGTLDTFFKDYVEPFVDTRGDWRNRVVDRYTVGFTNTSLGQLKRAQQIRSAYFPNNAQAPTIALELRPYNMDKQDARFVLDLGEQRVSYKHGPKFWTAVNWSGASTDQRIRLSFEDINGGYRDHMYTGNWTWFRLLDDAQLQQTAQANVYLITFGAEAAGHPRKVVYEGRARSVNSPFDARLLSEFQCPEAI